jgi:branched-chain amino acid aminotransferase
MPSTNYAYVNGKFVAESAATVSIFDRGFLYGDGIFETIRIYRGQPFRPLEHFDRLFDGLKTLDIESPFSPAELRAVCRALIRWNNVTDGVARVYRTRDSIVVTVQARQFAARELRAIVSSVQIDALLSRHKTANRLAYLIAQREAEREGVEEAVLLDHAGAVVEFTTGNLFVVKNGEVFTPPLSDGALPGITRHAVLALAREQRLPVYELSFKPAFLEQADEVFATNSLIEIAPVTTWSRRRNVTRNLQVAYRELVAQELSTPGP